MIYRVDERSLHMSPSYIWADTVYDYLNQYVDGLSHDTNSQEIDFWKKFKIRIRSDANVSLTLIVNGAEISLSSGHQTYMPDNRPFHFDLIVSDNFFLFNLIQQLGGSFSIIYAKDADGNEYVGGSTESHGWGSSWMYGTYTSLFDLSDLNSQYFFTKPLVFTPPPNQVGFVDYYFITNNTSKSIPILGLYSCTSLPYRSTCTILGHNYLAVDTNTLICIDDIN